MSYTTVIIDDEPIGIESLKQSLIDIDAIEITGTAKTPKAGIDLILKHHPDLLFLDVEMPEMSGLELLRHIKDLISWPMHVVFYTAYDKYLLEALRASAFDYLLKPYQPEDLSTVLHRFLHHVTNEHSKPNFNDTLAQLIPRNNTFMVATITGFQLLRIEQIGYFEYVKGSKGWNVILTDGQHLTLKRTTRANDILNYSDSFIQINQQQIINLDYLSGIKGKECLLTPPLHQEPPFHISRSFLKSLLEKLDII
jgi:two-component system LytT family response regulator